MRKNNSGFTLVELIVSIAIAALVFAAASSFMLFGMRMEKAASETAAAQNESNILHRVLESVAAEGRIGDVVYDPNYDHENNSEGQIRWFLYENTIPEEGENYPPVILGFNEESGVIFGKGGMTLLENLKSADISYENNVLSCSIETAKGEKYESSVYVRVGVESIRLAEIKTSAEETKMEEDLIESVAAGMTENEAAARKALLATMLSQYGSTGKIDDPASIYHDLYYSQWYKLEWGRDTPWCAIFVSWCLETMLEKADNGNKNLPWMGALVDTVMWYQFGRVPSGNARDVLNNAKHLTQDTAGDYTEEYLKLKEDYKNAVIGTWYYPESISESGVTTKFIPNPGDSVFFENDASNDRADHVGVVLYVDGNTLFTVEGNHNNRVGIFSYPMEKAEGATEYIIGYGVLNWSETGLVQAIPPEGE